MDSQVASSGLKKCYYIFTKAMKWRNNNKFLSVYPFFQSKWINSHECRHFMFAIKAVRLIQFWFRSTKLITTLKWNSNLTYEHSQNGLPACTWRKTSISEKHSICIWKTFTRCTLMKGDRRSKCRYTWVSWHLFLWYERNKRRKRQK
jgi:hypothetical protein